MQHELFTTRWFNAPAPLTLADLRGDQRRVVSIPRTMAAYEMKGTPTLLVFDRDGRLRLNHFGHIEDLALGAVPGELLAA